MTLNSNQSPDFLIKTAWHSIQRMYSEIARKEGVSQAMGFVLISISKYGSSPSEIAKKVGVKSISLTRTFNALEERKLITRNEDVNDGRKVILKLTEEGIEARKIIKEVINDFNDLILQKLSENEISILQKITFTIESLTTQYIDSAKENKAKT
jgi:DNA-binding MarR family transcriptional regulator